MSLQYSGLTIINTTFATTTRLDVVTGIAAALLSAGWTNISGSGTGNQVWKSMTTPQGFAMRVQLLDPGSGNCAQIFIQNATGSITQGSNPGYLFPGSTYRIIANGYQFCVFVPASVAARTWVMVGVPWVPSFLTTVLSAGVAFLGSNANSDTSTGTGSGSWRNGATTVQGNWAWLLSGSINGSSGTSWSAPLLLVPALQNYSTNPVLYADGSALICDPLLSLNGNGGPQSPNIVGMLWDAALISTPFTADITASFDSHNWWNLTSAGNASALFLATP